MKWRLLGVLALLLVLAGAAVSFRFSAVECVRERNDPGFRCLVLDRWTGRVRADYVEASVWDKYYRRSNKAPTDTAFGITDPYGHLRDVRADSAPMDTALVR